MKTLTNAVMLDAARRACPIGTPYSDAQQEFHRAAFLRRHSDRAK